MSSGRTEAGGGVEMFGRAQLPVHVAAEHVVAPLLVGAGHGLLLGRSPVEADLHEERLALAPAAPERLHDLAELLGLAAHREEPVRPAAHELGRRLGDRGAQQQGRGLGQRVDPALHQGDAAVMRDGLAAQERADDVRAFLERALRSAFSGQASPVMSSLRRCPLPRVSQSRPGYISHKVAAAWARIAGW
jgi:hypothetical protein